MSTAQLNKILGYTVAGGLFGILVAGFLWGVSQILQIWFVLSSLPLVGIPLGGLIGGMAIGFWWAMQSPLNLGYYMGIRVWFPNLVRRQIAHALGGETMSKPSVGTWYFAHPCILVPKDRPVRIGQIFYQVAVPSSVVLDYLKKHFPATTHDETAGTYLWFTTS